MSEVAEVLKNEVLVERFENAPQWMVYDSEMGFAVQQLRSNDFLMKIAKGSPNSLLAAMSNVAACGLSLNPAKKEAYLVPRKGKICLDPSYMGLCRLATDTGSIQWVQAKIVYASDEFIVHGVDERPTHNCDPFKKDRGEIVGAYCVAKTKDGDYLTEAMAIDDVFAIRNRSEAYKSNPKKTPWHTDEGEMIKKTVVKRASKMWPKSDSHAAESRLAAAVQVSHDNDEVKLVTSSPRLNDYNDEQKGYFDQLITDGNALDMYVLQQQTDRGVFDNLYNSFEKGAITKYKRIVDGLTADGFTMFTDYVNALAEAKHNGDEPAEEALRSECSESAWEYITNEVSK